MWCRLFLWEWWHVEKQFLYVTLRVSVRNCFRNVAICPDQETSLYGKTFLQRELRILTIHCDLLWLTRATPPFVLSIMTDQYRLTNPHFLDRVIDSRKLFVMITNIVHNAYGFCYTQRVCVYPLLEGIIRIRCDWLSFEQNKLVYHTIDISQSETVSWLKQCR